jgi:putative membrane protein
VLLAVLVAAIVRAFLRADRYRIESVMSPADREPVQAALREVESRTRGEVVPVVVGRSDPHPAAGWRAAVAVLAVGSALLLPHLPWNQPALFLLCQLVLGVAGYGIARWLPDFQRLFVSEQRATAVAQEQALQEFFGNRLFETRERTGVLLFVSLLEHRVVVLADQGVDERVRWTLMCEMPTRSASSRVLQCVKPGGGALRVSATIRALLASVILRGRPERALSCNPWMPSSVKRLRMRLT